MNPPPLYLLDTNIVIHYSRGQTVGKQVEADYSLLTTPYRPLICVVTQGEALAFARKRSWGAGKIAALKHILAQFVAVDISDPQIIEAYADLDAHSKSIGRDKMGKNDLRIAAVAQVSEATLMTTDGDFDHLAESHLQLIRIDQNTGATLYKSP
ncbi:MAG TPA: type II toxin-antitoxin system VapC family toxin [Tepidisphaeraceae bacterium]|nr:type II toxin-antitoxin system VapC family toxin [Tepidisphaeraceae bacterium]